MRLPKLNDELTRYADMSFKKAFNGVRAVGYIIGLAALIGVLIGECHDSHQLKNYAEPDFLILENTYEVKVARGRFQAYGREQRVRGTVASTGRPNTLSLRCLPLY